MTLDECFELGYIAKTHALKGQVVAELDVDDAAAYGRLQTVYVARKEAPEQLVAYPVESLRPQEASSARVWLKLKGLDRLEDVEPLRGAKLWLPLGELPPLAPDQFYFHDVLGYQVVDETAGPLGVVENFYELPQQDLLAMRYRGQEVLIPVVDELVTRADHAARQVFVKLPEGLLEVYLT